MEDYSRNVNMYVLMSNVVSMYEYNVYIYIYLLIVYKFYFNLNNLFELFNIQ